MQRKVGHYKAGEFCEDINCEYNEQRKGGDKRGCVTCKAYQFHEYLSSRKAIRDDNDDMPEWRPAITPPPTILHRWSDSVVAVTDFGNVLKLSYYLGDDRGVWQRHENMPQPGEKVQWWSFLPPMGRD